MQAIQTLLSNLNPGSQTTIENLTLIPLLQAETETLPPDYLTLDEALQGGRVAIAEISEEGSVPDLLLVNEGNRPVLLLDGEELIGAKQNRILNLSILAPPRAQLMLPVSCVEAGRWRKQSAEFVSSPHAYYASGRLKKMSQVTDSLRYKGRRLSNQGAVWGDIEMKSQRLKTVSYTQAMAQMYEQYKVSLEAYVRAFSPQTYQVGAMFAIADRIIGFDVFDSPATLHKLLPKLVRSYALDAIDPQQMRDRQDSPISPHSFLSAVHQVKFEKFPAIGEGEDVRLSGTHLIGSALVAREKVVHLSAFRSQ